METVRGTATMTSIVFRQRIPVGATNPNTGETAFAEQAPADQTQRRGPDVQPDGETVLYWGFS